MSERNAELCLAFAVDANCLEGLRYAIASFLHHAPDREIKLYLLDCESLNDQQQHWLDEIHRHPGLRMFNSDDIVDAATGAFLRSNRYFQTFVPFLDQAEPDRPTLYLDHDMACVGAFDPPRLADLGTATAGMVLDFSVHSRSEGLAEENARLGREPSLPMFNGGLLFSTPARMAAKEVSERCIALYQSQPDRYPVNDQDVLNIVLARDCLALDPQLNWQMNAQRYFPSQEGRIAHFTGKWKPWVKLDWVHGPATRALYSAENPFDRSAIAKRTNWSQALKHRLASVPLLANAGHRRKRQTLAAALGLGLGL